MSPRGCVPQLLCSPDRESPPDTTQLAVRSRRSRLRGDGKMRLLAQLLCLLVITFQDCMGNIMLTQSPAVLEASLGDFVTITCRANMQVGTSMAWYQQKPEQAPRLLIFGASSRAAGTPSRFRASGSGFDFSLAIHGVEAEDVGVFYCQQHFSRPLTVTDPRTKTKKSPALVQRHLFLAEGTIREA
uniref:Ig-like domain-containing protein n=1 Tax=Oryctolagus cuniculus TaxID=9986 RepID=A0A5F9CQV8_RABIT